MGLKVRRHPLKGGSTSPALDLEEVGQPLTFEPNHLSRSASVSEMRMSGESMAAMSVTASR